MRSRGLIFTISAPSGTGKTEIIKRLLSSEMDVTLVVSYTSRNKREGEKHGVDYFFVEKSEFHRMIDRGQFIQYEENYGELYGTPREQINNLLDSGRNILLDLDVRGMRSTKNHFDNIVVAIFLVPPSLEELRARLISRGRDMRADIDRRLESASVEIRNAAEYDYVVINDDIERCFSTVKAIVRAEQHRPCHYEDFDKEILRLISEQ